MGEFDDGRIMESKMQEINNWERNSVFDEVENKGQRTINIQWVITEKIKKGRVVCNNYNRLVAKCLEEFGKNIETDTPTCVPETLQLCISKIPQEGLILKSVHLKPPEEVKTKKPWKLKRTIYGLKDATRAWYRSMVEQLKILGGISSLDPLIFFWKTGKGLKGIMCSHVDDFFFYGSGEDFEMDVVRRLKDRLEVGFEKKLSFKYIMVRIRKEQRKVVMSQTVQEVLEK